MEAFQGFPADTFRFLRDLSANNNREWFSQNKQRYESSFLTPSLGFINALEPTIAKSAPLLTAEAKKVGGSLMRIYKDTRFSKDKTPYKTNIGIQFRHRAGKDVHAPGIYIHIAADECFFGAGVWRPASEPLRQIRQAISEQPDAWKKISRAKAFKTHFTMHNDRLKSAPRGYSKDDPLIDELRQKSYLCMAPLEQKTLRKPEIVKRISELIRASRPLMQFLCEAVGQPY